MEHVTVNEGGQAIVGNVTHGGTGAAVKRRMRPHERGLPLSKEPTLHRNVETDPRPCMAPAMNGWTVCRFHGARGGGPRGERNGMYRHGLYTKDAREERRLLSDLLRQSRKAIAALSRAGDK